jgi:saccharopine dehydrogenase-like NADP-dependent oxidoreductase
MKKQVVVLGGGNVGSAMAADLLTCADLEVRVVDARRETAEQLRERYGVATSVADLADPEAVPSAVAEAHVVLGALPAALAAQVLRAVVEVGRPYCDASCIREDVRVFHALAVEHEVTIAYDCGAAPGLSDLMAAHAATRLSPCDRIEVACAGAPRERRRRFDVAAAATGSTEGAATAVSPEWTDADGEPDGAILRVVAEGRRLGRRLHCVWEVRDDGDPTKRLASISRLAGLTAAAVARRIVSGDFRGQWGVFAPEVLGRRLGLLHGVLNDLAARGVRVSFSESPLAT